MKVWIYDGPTPWHFVTLPKKLAAEIKVFHGNLAKSFGSIGVTVTIGDTTWKTSVFSDTKSGSYVLPLKAEVRRREGIVADRTIQIILKIA
ncbi:DUF1905 domain-containing protein [Turneriella parva]|uniref:DUF1905 domain-containing protein n=1 Tax=Turneriella parva (strain ATCC BAA-1111 / DSM 21527 / NCTC 11395 / H) TaxID=869212 RepID=I4B700_TURPD|nr:DUF1905 domain-containing protein [Turneriella parva]AFM13057.1 protein of unknown function DUF1905 [Turneriella parva DSM 21527]